MSKTEPPKIEQPKPITDDERLDGYRAKLAALENETNKITLAIHIIEDKNNCESCHTPVIGPKGGACPACLGPTIKPAKDED